MFNKKIVFTSIASAILGLSLSANANLLTYNNTNEYSTVEVTSVSPHRCAASAGKITPPHGVLDVSDLEVKALCLGSKGPCKADIHLGRDCTSTPVAATASLNLSNMSVTVESVLDHRYQFRGEGNKFYINYA